jgi:hypothetical protein
MTKLTTDLAITPKRLGLIQMDSFCPRCFWYLLRQKFHPPFDHFGGAIFKNMEQAQMAIVGELLEKGGELPKEFAPFRDLVSRADYPRHWSKFKHKLDSGVLLYGEPDDIFEVSDGSIAVVDHKTAQPKGAEDPFLPASCRSMRDKCLEPSRDAGPTRVWDSPSNSRRSIYWSTPATASRLRCRMSWRLESGRGGIP